MAILRRLSFFNADEAIQGYDYLSHVRS
jgi:hypothetical protein